MGKMITFGDDNIPGYLAGDSGPGVVVLQEWWGLNDQMKGIADRLAAAGYRALTPDLFRGRVTQSPDEAQHMMNGLDWMGATKVDVASAVAFLKQDSDKVGVMGFCMGGALTILSAVHVDAIDAAVCFYGIPPREAGDPKDIQAPFQGHFGTLDGWCDPAAVAALAERLGASGQPFEIHSYEGADHAFVNEQRPEVYRPDDAKLAWERMVTFFGQNLAYASLR
ncbi:MAG: dienelactone hydrolase family protein [Myxococcota bacterium]